MNCCFMFNPLKQMESTKSELTPSVAEYLEKEKICQEICKTITQSVESTNAVPNANFDMQPSSLLPELTSDEDIEGILQQISELLGSQFGDNSQCSALDGNDNLSIEEILKEAENLVRASTPYFERGTPNGTQGEQFLIKTNVFNTKLQKCKLNNNKNITQANIEHNDTDSECPLPELDQEDFDNENDLIQYEDDITPTNEGYKNMKMTDDNNRSLDNADIENENCNERIPEAPQNNNVSIQSSNLEKELKLSDLQGSYDSTYVVHKDKSMLQAKMNNKIKGNEKSEEIKENKSQIHNSNEDDETKSRHWTASNMVNCEKQEVTSQKMDPLTGIEHNRLKLLQDEVKSQEELIDGYQKENQRLSNDILAAKELWKDTEVKLLDKVQKLDYQLRQTVRQKNAENEELNKKLKKSYDIIKKLENELFAVKEEKSNLNQLNEELTMNIARLNSEIEEYKKEIKCWGRHESEKLAAIENNALIESKLSHANTELTRKQTEIIRLNGEIGRLRGELEKIRLGSVINHTTDTSNTITQLQAALAMERENCRDIAMERDSLTKEVIDLRRQLKDTEALVIKRSKSGICLPLSDSAGSPYNSVKSTPDRKPKLDQELLEYKEQLNATKKNLKDLQAKYDHDTFELEQQVKRIQRENLSLKHLLDDNPKPPKRGPMTNAKEDAHLLATIRGLKLELNAREKDIMRLNKELDDARKTNKRLQKEREKALNSNQGNKGRANQFHKEIEKPSSRDVSSHNEYNPLMFEENQETLIFLRTENRNLKEEIKRLEQDLISLHNKRIQDLSDLQEQHESEISRLIREHAAKHSTSTVAHLQSQLYTQQMVIHHLKDQVKEFEEQRNELALLRTERDQLETTLIEANKKIARLHDLASPENIQYSGLLEKLEFLERRHEVREQKLQTIVRDLVAKQSQGSTCSANCRDKLLNKNREICYYRAEMDKILATLAEFRWTK